MDVEKSLPTGFWYKKTNPFCKAETPDNCDGGILKIRIAVLVACLLIILIVCSVSPKYYNLTNLKWKDSATGIIYTSRRTGFNTYILSNSNGEKCGSIVNNGSNYSHLVTIKNPNTDIIIKQFDILIDSGHYPSDPAIDFKPE